MSLTVSIAIASLTSKRYPYAYKNFPTPELYRLLSREKEDQARLPQADSRTHPHTKLVGQVRYKIEQVSGSITRRFGGSKARYVGLMKAHEQHVLEAIAYHLYRLPEIILSMA